MATLDADDLTAIAGLITTALAGFTGPVQAMDAFGNNVASQDSVNAIKAKTDQLTFMGGYVDANVRSITDVEGNQRSITSPGGSDGDPITIHQLAAATIADAVWDELLSGHATSGSAGAAITAIKAKTDLINTGSALVGSPVTPQGKVTQIFIGDDYLAANGRSFQWTIAAPTGFTAGTSTCSFGGSNGTDSWLVSGTITVSGSNWILSFDMTKTDTAVDPGNYDWTVEVKSASNVEHTVSFGGDTRLRRKYT